MAPLQYFCSLMRKRFLFLPLTIVCFAACKNEQAINKTEKKLPPKPGTVVAAAEMPVNDDPLNHFKFSVKVVADSNIADGVYDVDADFGPNFAQGQLTMPKGGENLTPVIKRSDKPYTFIIGFKVGNDTTFYDYFEVSSDKHTTKMQYVKAYSFQ